MSDEATPDRSQGYTVHSLARDIDRLRADIERVRTGTVGKDVFDIAQGSNRVDIGRLDNLLNQLDHSLDLFQAEVRQQIAAAAKETDRRFRAIVVGVLVVFVAPLTVGLILVAVNLLGRQ